MRVYCESFQESDSEVGAQHNEIETVRLRKSA